MALFGRLALYPGTRHRARGRHNARGRRRPGWSKRPCPVYPNWSLWPVPGPSRGIDQRSFWGSTISDEATLTEEWGTYTVTMNMETAVQGECLGEAGNEQLNLVLDMAGEQPAVVKAEGFQREYPWTGTETRDLAFPLKEGATAPGEGWAAVLHLDSQ